MVILLRKISFFLLSLLIFLQSPGKILANPTHLRQKQSEANQIKEQIATLDGNLEIAVEEYNQAHLSLEKTRHQIKAAREKLEKLKADLAIAQAQLNERAANIYKVGEGSFLEFLLATRTFSQFLNHFDFLKRLSAQDSQLVKRIRMDKEAIEKEESVLIVREKQEKEVEARLETKKRSIEKEIQERNTLLASIQEEINEIQRKEEEAERERQRAAAAAARERVITQQRPSERPSEIVSRGAPRSGVVEITMAQLGKPYVWAAAGPNSFDCSGLTLYVYSKVGVSLPHSAEAQYSVGQRINRENLQPGDLVFFSRGGYISHVGIYIGGDSFISAPQTGDVVKIQSLSARTGYVGATRP